MADDETGSNGDIQLGAYLRVLGRGWWIIVVLALVGVAVAVGYSLAQPKVYDASSAVYLGQITDANGSSILGLSSNPKAALELVQSTGLLRDAAKRAGHGETASRLLDTVTVATPTQTVKGTTATVNFVVITVHDANAERAVAAANAIAATLLDDIGSGPQAKVDLLQQQVATDQAQIQAIDARMTAAQRALAAIAAGPGDSAQKAAASVPYLGIVQAAASQESPLIDGLQHAQLSLQVAQNIEQPTLLHSAALPIRAAAPKTSVNAVVGLLVGLVVGVIMAFVRDRLRRSRTAA